MLFRSGSYEAVLREYPGQIIQVFVGDHYDVDSNDMSKMDLVTDAPKGDDAIRINNSYLARFYTCTRRPPVDLLPPKREIKRDPAARQPVKPFRPEQGA